MASAGGGDCEGAAPEADRPHQRPFLIGVSGGTASGKVRGWAAWRGLCRVRATPGPLGRRATRPGLRPEGRRTLGCRGVLSRRGRGGARTLSGSRARPTGLALGAPRSMRPLPVRSALLPSPALLSLSYWVSVFRSEAGAEAPRKGPAPVAA